MAENLKKQDFEGEIYKELETNLLCSQEVDAIKLFPILSSLLIDKSCLSKTGQIKKNRDACVDYIKKILPHMTAEDFSILEQDPDVFYKKFCFCPSHKNVSLALYLREHGILDEYFSQTVDLGWKTHSVTSLYQDFYDEYELSPFEKVDRNVLSSFWERCQDF